MEFVTDAETIKLNNDNFNLMPNGGVKKRIIRELNDLYKHYNVIISDIDKDYTYNRNAKITVSAFEELNGKQSSYKFIIDMNYPFVPPSVYYNNKKYSDLLRCNSECEIRILKLLKGIDCLSCSSYTCRDNWSPAVTMNHIINEIKYSKKCKRDIIYKIIADKIKRKYLIDDIDLDSYLF
jgi:ubiquitin-protein ligase